MNRLPKQLLIFLVLFETKLCQLVQTDYFVNQPHISEDGRLNFTGLAIKYGKPAEEHQVITQDGYILTIFHIPGPRCPVFLEHGIIDSADTFLVRGNISLGITLARAGYDVWFGNARGNKYSRKHVKLDPDTDKDYWNFTMHEIGHYDLPAMIDFVLESTGKSQLIAAGQSQGNAIFYVLGSTRPEYNDKIKVLIALAPVCYLHHVRPPVNLLVHFSSAINAFLLAIGQEELFRDHSATLELMQAVCSAVPLRYEICALGGFLFFAGGDPEEFEKAFLDVIIWHYPSGTSRLNGMHLAQIATTNEFKQFDYGAMENLERYGRLTPPKYDLRKVTMHVELFTGRNDKVATAEDVKILWKKLPNATYRLLDHKKMNHLDFVWGKHVDEYLYPLLFKTIQKYCN